MALARTVSATNTQRAKKAAEKQNAKTVYKPVLDNPFTITWPNIQTNVQNAILAASSEVLGSLRDYHLAREETSRRAKNAKRQRRFLPKEQVEPKDSRKRKRESDGDERGTTKRRCTEEPSAIHEQTESSKLEDQGSVPLKEQASRDILQISSPPALLDSLEIGLNEVTRALERSITTLRSCQNKKQLPSDFKPISLVLVCLADINPPNLVAHIPHLVSIYNSMLMTQGILTTKKRRTGSQLKPVPPRPDGIKLVTLPKNAEPLLAGSIGLRRISVVAFYDSAPLGVHLTTLLSQTPILAVPWQIPQAIPNRVAAILERAHIKHIATTAPLDMNLARKERQQGRKNAKTRRQAMKLEERKKRIAEVQAKETAEVQAKETADVQTKKTGTVQVFEKPRDVGRERMKLRSATAVTIPPATTTATTSPRTRTKKTASASATKSGKSPARRKVPLRTSPRLALNNSNQKGKKVKEV